MTGQEFVSTTMDKISAIKEYKEKYGEEVIITYYNSHGTYTGIEEYLKEYATKKQSSLRIRTVNTSLSVKRSADSATVPTKRKRERAQQKESRSPGRLNNGELREYKR